MMIIIIFSPSALEQGDLSLAVRGIGVRRTRDRAASAWPISVDALGLTGRDAASRTTPNVVTLTSIISTISTLVLSV